jgi:predicted S18 family serine protease
MLIALTLTTLIGCAQPPTAELAAAETALAAAKEAGAAEYLPSLVEGAEAALDQARQAIESGKYEAARGLLTQASSQAQKAASQVGAAKAAVGEQLSSRIAAVSARLPMIEEHIASIEKCSRSKRKGLDFDTAEARVRHAEISANLDAVTAASNGGDFLAGLEDIDAVSEDLTELNDQVAQAKETSGC